jgi:uncharacterized repeat protein (TIGR04076 family)
MADVKISVVKKLNYHELFGPNPPAGFTGATECDRLEVGQEFISEEGGFPTGFCAWAFADIQRDVSHLRLGGDYPWAKEKGSMVSCCTDGFRPVIFKLERL